MFIADGVEYIGVNDHDVDLFEGQYTVKNGMSYNSYAILDEKIAIMDTVDTHFTAQWLANLKKVLSGRTPDYLVVQHMEPDHSANIATFMQEYPTATIVASANAFVMMGQFFQTQYENRRIVVKEGSKLSLGKRTLTFVAAPMVHWPEVIVTYDDKDEILFSADGFGKFGALDVEEPWKDEARRYYIGIVGKYGVQVQNLLKKAAILKISKICPLHGPVLDKNLDYYLGLYNTWSSYTPEEKGVTIAYASIYGNTKKAALLLAEKLQENGVKNIAIYDLARDDMAAAVASAFKYSTLVLAAPTYNGDVFPCMRTYLSALTERNFQNRTICFIENGTWAPWAIKAMKKSFENSKNLTYLNSSVTIKSALNANSKAQLAALAEELILVMKD